MTKTVLAFILITALSLVGCAFNRSDFVAGPNGRPKEGEMSDTGKVVGDVVKNRGPSYRFSF
jgi:hypothetical protein